MSFVFQCTLHRSLAPAEGAPIVYTARSRGDALTRLLGLPDNGYGRLSPAELPAVITRAEEVLLHPDTLELEARPGIAVKGPDQPMYIDSVDGGYLRDRVGAVLRVLRHALEHQLDVMWL